MERGLSLLVMGRAMLLEPSVPATNILSERDNILSVEDNTLSERIITFLIKKKVLNVLTRVIRSQTKKRIYVVAISHLFLSPPSIR